MALLRDRLGNAADLPLTLVLRRPNGMEARRYSQTGGLQLDFIRRSHCR